MLKMRKFAAAAVLGLIMCLVLSTGAFAQSAIRGHVASATAIAVSNGFDGGFGPFGFGGGFGPFGFGGFGGGFGPFGFGGCGCGWGGFGGGSFAVASAFAG